MGNVGNVLAEAANLDGRPYYDRRLLGHVTPARRGVGLTDSVGEGPDSAGGTGG
jgi:hypothetical protein